jgi:GntR family transcriptional regulator/MocR family aminotransferase
VPGSGECLLEDPITADVRRIIEAGGGRVRPVPVDEQGMMTELLPASGRPRLIYLTPSHQFPLGVTMPIQRRLRLLEYARRRGAYILEDDYDSEFRYESPPLSAIQGLDPQRVVYIGTFSKTLCPSLRIGYVVFPPALVSRGRQAKWFADLHNASVDQLILARFIAGGHFARHVQVLKRAHRAQRQLLVGALREAFGEEVRILGHAAGLHLCARFPGVRFGPALLAELERSGARVYPVEEHAIRKGRYRDTVILGYGLLGREAIRRGVAALAAGLRKRKD